MAEDLADRLDDLICTFDKVIPNEFEGTVFFIILIWAVVGTFVYFVSAFISKSLKAPEKISEAAGNGTSVPYSSEPVVNGEIEKHISAVVENNAPSDESDALKTLNDGSDQIHTEGSPIPVSSGSDKKAVEWVNQCIQRIFEPSSLETLKEYWYESLSEYVKSIDEKSYVRIVDIYNVPNDGPSIFSNVVTQSQPRDNVIVTADINGSFSMKINAYGENYEAKSRVHYFQLDVHKFRGRLNIAMINYDRLAIIKLDGWPEIHTNISRLNQTDNDDEYSEDTITDLVTSALRRTQIKLNMDKFTEGYVFPIFKREKNIQTDEYPPNSIFNREFDSTLKTDQKPSSALLHSLSVLVVKAAQIQSSSHPYVIVELDEPSQKFKTGLSESLIWNEDFTLHLSPHSKEILFEVWDIVEGEEEFLGLGIVAIDELLIAPSQRHVIPLQGRPYRMENEESLGTGILTIQFILSDLNENLRNQSNPNKNIEEHKDIGIASSKNGMVLEENQIPCPNEENIALDENAKLRDESPSTRSRNRKKRKLVSTFKKRLTGRSLSLSGLSNSKESSLSRSNNGKYRSVSADSGYSLSNMSENGGNLKDVSAISTATFIAEESSLVIEADENNIKKYYCIPVELAVKGKINLKGTKLHIFMDHLFVAKHIKRGKSCDVCSLNIPFRLGKQGYECRDCKLICHKPCHIHVSTHCLETSLPAMNIIYKKNLT